MKGKANHEYAGPCLLVLRFTNRWHECIEDSDYGNLLQEAASRENEQGKKPLLGQAASVICIAPRDLR